MVAEKLLGGDDSDSRPLAQGLNPEGPLLPLPQLRQQRNQLVRNFQQMHNYNVNAPHPALGVYAAMDALPHGNVAWKPMGASYPSMSMQQGQGAAATWYSSSPAMYRPMMHTSGAPTEGDWITQKYQNGGRFAMPAITQGAQGPGSVPYHTPFGALGMSGQMYGAQH
jgi:hypothetical protein